MRVLVEQRRVLSCLVIAAALGGGCSDAVAPYRSVLRDQAKAAEELEQILSTVTDQASMQAAQVELKKRWQRFDAITERAQGLPPPNRVIAEKVLEERARHSDVLVRAAQQWIRVRALPGGEDFLKPFGQGQGFLGNQTP